MAKKIHNPSHQVEKVIHGFGISPGIAMGHAKLDFKNRLFIAHYTIKENQIDQEFSRLSKAITLSQEQLETIKSNLTPLPPEAAEEMGYLIDAHLAMLNDSRLVRGIRRLVQTKHINVEAAIESELDIISSGFVAMKDKYLSLRIEEIEDVCYRLLKNLKPESSEKAQKQYNEYILITDNLSPSELASLNPKNILGFCSTHGGMEGHTSIMARSMGLPAIMGIENLQSSLKNNDYVIIDGKLGKLFINPSKATLEKYKRIKKNISLYQKKLTWERSLDAITKEGVRIQIETNLDLARQVYEPFIQEGDGIGLLRTEFLFMNVKTLPDEEFQYNTYKEILDHISWPLTVRLLDAGGDKILPLIENKNLSIKKENSYLGLRAVRLLLKFKTILRTQIRALLKASAHGEIKILLPMVSNVEEVKIISGIILEEFDNIKKMGLSIAFPKIGIMIETPACALNIRNFRGFVDFASIGSNDLTMYTLAIDRSDDEVAYLYNPLHPSVLKLMQTIVLDCEENHIPINICGEIAGNPFYIPLLIGLGLRSFSMSPRYILPVKQKIRQLTLKDCENLLDQCLECRYDRELFEIINKFNS